MQAEEIEKFLTKPQAGDKYIKISFRKREAFYGLFLKGADFDYLKAKNFWRIVPQTQLNAFTQSGDERLARIFSGSEFTRLVLYAEAFEE